MARLDPEANINHSLYVYFSESPLLHYSKKKIIANDLGTTQLASLIVSGYIESYTISEDKQYNQTLIYQSGDLIPFPLDLRTKHSNIQYYRAMGEVTLLQTSRKNLVIAMGKDQWLSQEIFKQMIRTIDNLTIRVATLELKSARLKIVSEFIYLAEQFGITRNEGVLIDVPITHQQLANSLNMSRETTSRSLEILTKANLIARVGDKYIVLELDKLKAELN